MSVSYENAYESTIDAHIRLYEFTSEENLEIFLKNPNGVLHTSTLRSPMDGYSFTFGVTSGPEWINGNRSHLSEIRTILIADSTAHLEKSYEERQEPILNEEDAYFLGRIAGSLGADKHLRKFYANVPYRIVKKKSDETGVEVNLDMLTIEQIADVTTAQRQVTTPANTVLLLNSLNSYEKTRAEFLQNGDLFYRHGTRLITVSTAASAIPTA